MGKYWTDKKRHEKKRKETKTKRTEVSPVKKSPREYFSALGIRESEITAFLDKEVSPLSCADCGRSFEADVKMEYGLECVYMPDCLMHALKQAKTVKTYFR